MLVAYGPDRHPLIAEEDQLAQLQLWSHERMLHCPNCRGIVHVRGGPEKRTQLHFAHQKGECAWSTEAESVRHAQGKLILARWLRLQYPLATITLEERLPEPNRIADVFLVHPDGRRWAIEFQCAPLDIAEWKHRHTAYRQAGIIDIWIIGVNRREKQEAFLEAVLMAAREILFLDPLVNPPRVWLRWPVHRQEAQQWQEYTLSHPTAVLPGGWVGRTGFGMTLSDTLLQVQLNQQAQLVHLLRSQMAQKNALQHQMRQAHQPEAEQLTHYLQPTVGEEALRSVLLPLLKSYLQDPDLLRRYNYGRGLPEQPVTEADRLRIRRAVLWLKQLGQQGFSTPRLQEIVKAIPYSGPYAAFASYAEMLLALTGSV